MLILEIGKGLELGYSSITFDYISCFLTFDRKDVANVLQNLGLHSD